MICPSVPATLALSLYDFAIYGFALLFVVIPWIVKTLKDASGNANSNRSRRRSVPAEQQTTSAERRRQLEELARQRREAISHRSARPATNEPTNLTMAQRVERAKAMTAYQQRSQQQQVHPQSLPSPPQIGQPPVTMTMSSRKPTPVQEARDARRRQQRLTDYEQDDTAGRVVSDVTRPTDRPKHSLVGRLNGPQLRKAILLKEILDRPIALRPQSADLVDNH